MTKIESTCVDLEDITPLLRAVIYLRVSSAGQLTGRDAEGFSIAAQRDACHRKAHSLGAVVAGEYVDKAESARSADRAELQAMLERLATERDVDFVIVHKVDRLARNRADDVTINMAIKAAGATLVSVSENIDETPSGTLLHGIMSSIAEFYSKNLATEIVKGMSQKAKTGAYPGHACVGYLNAREVIDGREIRVVTVDPERAPLITWAFEAYASSEYSVLQLTEALEAKGLTTRPTPKFPARPLAVRHVHNMLRNHFYVGMFSWSGVEHVGRHTPLVSVETFSKVQAILSSRGVSGERQRKHPHYLKGTLFCGRCQSRLSFLSAKGRSQHYDYFYCLGKMNRRTDCDLPHIPVEVVEDSLTRYYGTIQMSEELQRHIADRLIAALKTRLTHVDREAHRQRQRILALETKRRKLMDAYYQGAVPADLLKEEQDKITKQLADTGAALANIEVSWETIERNVNMALSLAGRFQTAYRQASKETKRQCNQAVIEAAFVDVTGVTYTRLTRAFDDLLANDFLDRVEAEMKNRHPSLRDSGSSKDVLVRSSQKP
jgi:site-specific DNA recombinase